MFRPDEIKNVLFTVPHLQHFFSLKKEKKTVFPFYFFYTRNHPNAFSVSIYLCDGRIWNESEKARVRESEGARQ